jgi:hypothetical protein
LLGRAFFDYFFLELVQWAKAAWDKYACTTSVSRVCDHFISLEAVIRLSLPLLAYLPTNGAHYTSAFDLIHGARSVHMWVDKSLPWITRGMMFTHTVEQSSHESQSRIQMRLQS